jgi:hypothetical protein
MTSTYFKEVFETYIFYFSLLDVMTGLWVYEVELLIDIKGYTSSHIQIWFVVVLFVAIFRLFAALENYHIKFSVHKTGYRMNYS